jgi:GNAT superfamily N-acetyltransferase
MDITLRPATPDDIPTLARLHFIAAHGFLDALYHDLIPGLPANEIYERVLAGVGATLSYENAWVAVRENEILGEVHAFPYDDFDRDPPNPILPEDRLVHFEPFERIGPPAAGTYHVNILAVYPEFRGHGLGRRLMELARSHAKQRGFSKLSLFTIDDPQLVPPLTTLYERLGFVTIGRTPMPPHELYEFSGDLLLMSSPA